jgi:glycosyltransferase involved in cell wall biosynthesis
MNQPQERTPIATAAISVILPVRNRGAKVADLVDAWLTHLDKRRQEYQLLLVDDGSTDDTAARAEALAARHPQVQCLRHATARGFGAALRTGLEAARHPLVAYAPCDARYPPSSLKALLEWIDKVDLVAGYRTTPTGPLRKTWRERLGRRLAGLFFGVHMQDLDCWFVLARRAIFSRIPIQSDGRFAHLEILAKASFLGCWMTEAAVKYRPSPAGEVDPWSEPGRQWWREALRVFSHPDFGPPNAEPAVPSQSALSLPPAAGLETPES